MNNRNNMQYADPSDTCLSLADVLSEPPRTYTSDSRGYSDRWAYALKVGVDEYVPQIVDLVTKAGECKARDLLAGSVANVAFDHATGRIKVADDQAFASLCALIGVAAGFVANDLEVPPTQHGVQIAARLPGERRLRYLPILGWRDHGFGWMWPTTYVDLGNVQWAIIDWDARHAVRTDGSICSIDDIKVELMEETTGGSR